MNIVLTGFMGTGKTAVGKLLAKKLGMSFLDTDEIIEKDVGMSVSEIFSKHGEPYFRKAEREAVRLVSLLDNYVIATGGGVPISSENMRDLGARGVVVHLSATAATILQRTQKNGKRRPLLEGKNPARAHLEALLREREETYRQCAFSVSTDSLSLEEVAQAIIKNLRP